MGKFNPKAIADFEENRYFVQAQDYDILCSLFDTVIIERMRDSNMNYCGIYGPSCERELHVKRMFNEKLRKEVDKAEAELAEIKGY